MFLNYLIVALRSLRKQPGFSAIRVLSLTLGLVCSILVLMHVRYTNSYDKHFDNWQDIYRVVTNMTSNERIESRMIAEAIYRPLLQDYGQIELAAKIRPGNALFSNGDMFAPNEYLWVEREFLSMFSFDFIQGDVDTALSEPNSIVLTEMTARKFFGQDNAMGRTLTMDNGADVRVTGLIRDLPPNTHITIEAMVSASTGRQVYGETFMDGNGWILFSGTMLYIVIPDSESADALRMDLANFVDRNIPAGQRDYATRTNLSLDLESLADLHLSPRLGYAPPDHTRRLILTGLIAFSALILLSSCINFASLSLSQMQQRHKEVGIRKALGAAQSSLLTQFLVESMLLTSVAFLLALPLVYIAIGPYTALTETAFTFGSMFSSAQVLTIASFVLLTGLISGLIPALRMARLAPNVAINSKRDGGRANSLVRAGFTTIQFSFAILLVILAIGISLQVRHLNMLDIGFNRSDLVVLDTMYNPRNPDQFNYNAMLNDLSQHPGVLVVGRSESAPPFNGGYNPWRKANWPPEQSRAVSHLGVNENYVPALQLQILAGRNFSPEFPSDYMPEGQPDTGQTYGILITTAAVGYFDLGSNEEALDEILTIQSINFRIVGVINDFRLSGGLEDAFRSTSILRASNQSMRALLVRIDPNNREDALNHIDAVWDQHRPGVPINREFYEQFFSTQIHEKTNGINRAAQFAAIVTILIAALGLLALAHYSTQRRTKEVGVRKVLGASPGSVIKLLSIDFIKPVLLACVVASIAAYVATSYYFSQFSAPATLSPVIYMLVVACILLLSLLTVAGQCLKAARSDPVISLRSE